MKNSFFSDGTERLKVKVVNFNKKSVSKGRKMSQNSMENGSAKRVSFELAFEVGFGTSKVVVLDGGNRAWKCF